MHIIDYCVEPEGIDQYWTTSLELYCYLYYNKRERVRLQTLVNLIGEIDGQFFHLYHRCDPFHLRLRKGQSDLEFQYHLRVLFYSIRIEMVRVYPLECTSTSIVFTISKYKIMNPRLVGIIAIRDDRLKFPADVGPQDYHYLFYDFTHNLYSTDWSMDYLNDLNIV